jgi:hypothetical protein
MLEGQELKRMDKTAKKAILGTWLNLRRLTRNKILILK